MFSSNAVVKRLGTLRVVGPDGVGLLAASTQVLNHHGCNILKSEQWTDTRENICFQRVSFHYNGVANDLMDLHRKTPTLKALWDWRDRRKKIGILVSKYDHCLWELLLRHKARELDADISVVISNHETLRPVAETFGIPYHVISPTKVSATETSSILPHHEVQQLELLKDVDVVILARYMQVLSSEFLKQFPKDGIINIHHSFLPAFLGGSPHRQAHERGVKLIGATAHFTTEVLDDGPIIEQDVINCSHRDSVQQLVKKGRVLERNVLLKAIEAHLDDRIIVHGNRCVVFGD
ncbi:formyltetrahydrofolate deformylase [Fragilariopsis cylindrus CCMP1102]|uniref:Formyltetrahydrofolate deformylase n=1 Tax=Fragilariopsis cylindrus CCMP1102 TaxID=635003 RepID=A0A1E7FCG7_9STRA|nr:formyltetrahydrofolate deformylase [Fragilariopsis cylindrus CCMP1102]|eukprot:OEU15857.1 formyltetrahydrofolate deformylase [Fragilariopsis cylindrus CCMP1102]